MIATMDWTGELHGALMVDRQELHHVVWDPDAETPTGLPVVRLPEAPDLMYTDERTDWNAGPWRNRIAIVQGSIPELQQYHQLRLLDQDRGRALLFDDSQADGWVHLTWLDLETGATRPIASWDPGTAEPRWQFLLLPGGDVDYDGPPIATPTPGFVRLGIAATEGDAVVGRGFIVRNPGDSLERWSSDGQRLLSRIDAGFGEYAVDVLGRVWGCDADGLHIIGPRDEPLLDLPPRAFDHRLVLPDFRGVDRRGRAWFEDDGVYFVFRIQGLEIGD